MQVLAVIPARSGSKRLPGKNTKHLQGKPLISWSIEFAQSVPWFNAISVSTDSQDIADLTVNLGVEVPSLRPMELAKDETSTFDVVVHVLQEWEKAGKRFDAVALLQPTSPIRFRERWEHALQLIDNGACDAAVGVCPASIHPFLIFKESSEGFLTPWVENKFKVTRSQDFPPAYAINGALYLIKTEILMQNKTFFPAKCGPVICEKPVENIDIDTPLDWKIAEMLIDDWRAGE